MFNGVIRSPRTKKKDTIVTFDCCWVVVDGKVEGKRMLLCDLEENAVFVFNTKDLAWGYIACHSPDLDGCYPERMTWKVLADSCVNPEFASFDKAIINPSPE